MRATVSDVLRHPSWLRDWWGDVPWRHREPWALLLLEPGQGWLRWGIARVEIEGAWDHNACAREPGGEMPVAPPMRRVWIFVREFFGSPFYARRTGEAWRWCRPSWSGTWRGWADPERGWAWRR